MFRQKTALVLLLALAHAYSVYSLAEFPSAPASANTSRYLQIGPVRFSLLTPAVVRVEVGQIEDRGSITFPHRTSQPVPTYKIIHQDSSSLHFATSQLSVRFTLELTPSGSVIVDCAHLNVTLSLLSDAFSSNETVACVGEASGRVPRDTQFPGTVMDEWTDIIRGTPHNLNGSLDSTDCYANASTCYGVLQGRVQLGLLSRDGWTVVDDSSTALWANDSSWPWRTERFLPQGSFDWYVFAHGLNYRQALQDFVNLAGPVGLKPYRAHGVWQSREMMMTDHIARGVIENYNLYQLPLHMFVLDYGWHVGPYDASNVSQCRQPLHAGGQCLRGFGGYVWDKTSFPNPQQFLDFVHEAGLLVMLNLHDQCGIDSCQENYPEIAKLTGVDPSGSLPVQCHFLNKSFAAAQAELILESGDHKSVDFYWNDYGLGGPGVGQYVDACYSNDSATPSLPHGPSSFPHCLRCYADEARAKSVLWNAYVRCSRKELTSNQRGMVLGIYGGLGHHRYPGVGSGDTFEAWETLAAEIYLTTTASNVAVEWNHDLGGFMPGEHSILQSNGTWLHNPEMYARWLQAGVYQPIFRTHMSEGGNPWPWVYPNFEVLQQSFQFRMSLMPYIYTASFDSYRSGVLANHPLYYDYPAEEEAYLLSTLRGPGQPLQFMFGPDFTAAPITAFANSNQKISWTMWVPPDGPWLDYWTAQVVKPGWYTREYSQWETPLLVRGMSVIPMKGLADSMNVAPQQLYLSATWAGIGMQGAGHVYEDEGDSLGYVQGDYWYGEANFMSQELSASFQWLPRVQGKGYVGALANRSYLVRIRGAPPSTDSVTCPACNSETFEWYWENEQDVQVLCASTGIMPSDRAFIISIGFVIGLVIVQIPQAASDHLGGCLHGTSSDGTCNGWQSASGDSKAYDNGRGVCSEGTFGSTCTSACPSGCLIDDCELENGECVGPTTTWSSISGTAKAYGNGTGICRQGVFGSVCSKKCPPHCLIADCEVENGECVGPTATWTDINGNAKSYGNGQGICQPGFYGPTCSSDCPPNCLIQDCEVAGGECVGPTTTWTSISSDAKAYDDGNGICRPGFYGPTCSNACPANCLITDCEVENGECVGPKTTWSQISGDAKAFGNGTGICKAGYYGATCTSRCPVHCLSTDCEVDNGQCVGPHNTWSSISGNAPAFGGGSGICQSSYWGPDCTRKCPAACPFDCTVENGQCLS